MMRILLRYFLDNIINIKQQHYGGYHSLEDRNYGRWVEIKTTNDWGKLEHLQISTVELINKPKKVNLDQAQQYFLYTQNNII